MPWRPLPQIAFAVAVFPFEPTSPSDLPLELGDELYIIEEGGVDGSWYRGYLVAPPSMLAGLTSVKGQTLEARVFSGVFPRCCVEVREVLQDPGRRDFKRERDIVNGLPDDDATNGVDERHSNSTSRRASLRLSRSLSTVRHTKSVVNGRVDSRSGAGADNARSVSGKLVDGIDRRNDADASISTPESRRSENASTTKAPDSHPSGSARPPAPVPMLKIGDETPTSLSEPLVDEIASCLREWHSTKVHELLLTGRYSELYRTYDLIQQLDLARRQLLHGILTDQELKALREKTVWNLNLGNKMLSNEVIVRDPQQSGRLLTGNDSVVDISKLQSTMSLLDTPVVSTPDPISLHHLMVEIKDLQVHGQELSHLMIYLCSVDPGQPPKPLSESFTIDVPSRDQVKVFAPEKLKTLFTNLALNDLGESPGSETQVYLVIRIQGNQLTQPAALTPSRQATTREPPAAKSAGTGLNGITRSTGSVAMKGGRRSLMWAQKQMTGSVRHRTVDTRPAEPAQPPSYEDAAIGASEESRPKTPAASQTVSQQGPQYVKRNLGVGMLNVKTLLRHEKSVDQSVPIWSAAERTTDPHNPGDGWNELIRELAAHHSGPFIKSKIMESVKVHLHSFTNENADILIKKTPTVLHNISQTPKIGFSGAPSESRSDIYITLDQAFLPFQALFSHPERGPVQLSTNLEMHNMQLTLEVRRSTGDRIENCIFPSSTGHGQTAWRTAAVRRGEAWSQIIKLVIPQEDVPNSHLIMSIADAPGFPFALCWMPLWVQQAFVKDGRHSPLLYLYDKSTSSTDSGKGAYLDFPWSTPSRGEFAQYDGSMNSLASLRLESYLCSTAFSQDKVLLSILHWREQPKAKLLELLRQLTFVPEIEIVKLVDQVLDALFNIFVDHAANDEFEDATFNDLVNVLSIVHDRRFKLGPAVDDYIEKKFRFPYATPCLIRSYQRLLSNPTATQNSRQLRATFKVGRQIFKLIVKARGLQQAKEAGIGITTSQSTFSHDLRKLFTAMESLMKDPSPILVGTRTLIMQHMHTWLPELNSCFTWEEVSAIAFGFLDACADVQNKLIMYKLILILNISKSDIFSHEQSRRQLVDKTPGWLEDYWGFTSEPTDQWQEQIRICCSIVLSQMNELNSQTTEYFVKTIGSYRYMQMYSPARNNSVSLLFPSIYPFPHRPIQQGAKFNETLIELAALLASLSNKPLPEYLPSLEESFGDILSTALEVCLSILSGEAFPESWLTLNVFHHRSILRTLESLYNILSTTFLPSPDDADDFPTELWRAFFTTLLKLVRSSALALETFPEQKRRAVWKIAGDVREQGAELLRRSWEVIGWEASDDDQMKYGLQKLGGYQVQYVPALVSPVVELCLSVHEGLRGVAVETLQSMIVSEWTLNEDLGAIQFEMIDCLDQVFVSQRFLESVQQKLFIGELLDRFERLARLPNEPLWEALKMLVTTIDELLDLLIAVHSPDATEAVRIMNTLRLMEFLKDMQKEDIYIRYVHELASIQAESRNPTEAGLALRQHADMYEWSSVQMVDKLQDPKFPEQSSFERKERIYFEMIKYFEDGAAWDCALASYRELAEQYENYTFDYSKLARTQRSMAKIYETIAKGESGNPRYFRVIFKGLGFPPNLKDKMFIYQGNPAEKVSTFAERILLEHPAARLAPLEDITNAEGQYLHISAVSTFRNLDHPMYQRPRIPQSTREFLLSSQPNQFAITSRRHSPKSGVKNQWIEKTVYTTNESLPTILRRSEIGSIEVIAFSPLQTALERTTRKTSELGAMAKRSALDDQTASASLLEAIKTSVDNRSPTTVAQYRELLPTMEPPEDEEESGEKPVLEPLENALRVALVDHAATLKHCLALPTLVIGLTNRDDLLDQLASTFATELATLAPKIQSVEYSRPETPWLPAPEPALPLSLDRKTSTINRDRKTSHKATGSDVTVTAPTEPAIQETSRQTSEPLAEMIRNRLSLSFLKRQSMLEDSKNPMAEDTSRNNSTASSVGQHHQLNGYDYGNGDTRRDGHNGDIITHHDDASTPRGISTTSVDHRAESVNRSSILWEDTQDDTTHRSQSMTSEAPTPSALKQLSRNGSLPNSTHEPTTSNVNSDERPVTADSSVSAASGADNSGQGSAVKKRQSLLSIGEMAVKKASKKASKGNFFGGGGNENRNRSGVVESVTEEDD
ncbi:hypothetical protein MMC09_003944 [Bachmanniomyces sp. S44760]|nr:hypothetical protein [Bachmanniomyces sp. S44760]